MTNFITGRKRIHITNQLIGFTHIATHDRHQRFVNFTFIGKLHDRDVKPFFVDTGRIRPEAATANINDVRSTGKETNMLPFMKGWRHNRNVMQVPCPFPWVISDINIPFKHIVDANATYKMSNCICHCVYVTRRTCNRLRKHLTSLVIDTRR